jgi:hypothetical protein
MYSPEDLTVLDLATQGIDTLVRGSVGKAKLQSLDNCVTSCPQCLPKLSRHLDSGLVPRNGVSGLIDEERTVDG